MTADAAPFADLGARVIPDPSLGLNAAIAAGLAAVDGPTAILLGDHPALTTHELQGVLHSASLQDRALVADSDGTGSALTTSRTTHDLKFGPGSRDAHVAAGYVELAGDWPGLRRDVDTREQLAQLGSVGRHTAAALHDGD